MILFRLFCGSCSSLLMGKDLRDFSIKDDECGKKCGSASWVEPPALRPVDLSA
jgi:hypothetical protein